MSRFSNMPKLFILLVAILLTCMAASAPAADFAPAVNIAAGMGPSAIVSGYFDSSCSTAPSGLISWWPGDNTADDVVGGHNATLQGGATYAAGSSGQAFSLDTSDDYVLVSNSSDFSFVNQPFTIRALVKRTGPFPSTEAFGAIFDRTQPGTGNGYRFDYSTTWGLRLIGSTSFQLAYTLNQDIWYDIAAVSDGAGTATFYVNGAAVGSGPYSSSLPYDVAPRIGNAQNNDALFVGLLDEVQVYGRALSPAEIQNLNLYACTALTPDMAVVNFSSNSVSVFLGNGDGTFQPKTDIAVGTEPYGITSADFNGDGYPDLAVANSAGNNVSVLLNNGSGAFAVSGTYAAGTTPYAIAAGDFDNDGSTDLAVVNNRSRDVSILLGSGTGTFTPTNPAVFKAGSDPVAIVAGNFDSDAADEFAIADFGTGEIMTYELVLDAGLHKIEARSTSVVGGNPIHMTAGDFNGDAYPDLAIASANSHSVSILVGIGSNLFMPPATFEAGEFPGSVSQGDLNGDGKADLTVTNLAAQTVSVLYGNGNGRLQYPLPFAVGNNPLSVVQADFDSDFKADLAVANFNDDNFSLLLNTTGSGIIVTAPAGGEHIASGSVYNVTWNAFPGATRYQVLYSCTNGLKFKKLASLGNVSNYSWTVPMPKTQNLDDCLIKVVGYNDSKAVVAQGMSSSSFSIEAVRLTSPNGGETIANNSVHTITWTTNATKKTVNSVKISYSTDGGLTWLTAATVDGNPGTYDWTVPDMDATVTGALVKVDLKAGSGVIATDRSDTVFTITP